MPKVPKNAKNAKNVYRAGNATNAKSHEFNQESFFYHNSQGTNGGAAVLPPQGVFNPPPHLVGAQRARSRAQVLPILLPQILATNFFQEFLTQEASDPYLFLSPGAPRHRKPSAKKRKSLVFANF